MEGQICNAGQVFERFTDQSRQVLVLAQEEASLLNHSFIGTEHLLLGLIRADDGVASKVLTDAGVRLPAVRDRVEETIGLTAGRDSGSPPFTPRTKKVLELSLRESNQLGHNKIGTEHLLLGLIREGEGVACQVLVDLGANLGEIRRRVMQHLVDAGAGEASRDPTHEISAPSSTATSAKEVACSFCGRAPPESGRIISGSDAFICESCIRRWYTRLRPRPNTVRPVPASPPLIAPPAGFEPEGADQARSEITAAFAASRTSSDDGQAIPAVERGHDLGPTLALANERHRHMIADGSGVLISADEIHFYDRNRALVVFSISIGERLLLGGQHINTLLIGGEWKMARSTFCRLMDLAGIACPPETD
jgi:Clp amino terminal domain, pathogenicity island component/ClpX C4-type zinc finger